MKLAQWFWNRRYSLIGVFEIYRPTREIFTHMETSLLPVKVCCKFWPILGDHGHLLSSEGSLACHPYCDTGLPFIIGHLRGPVTLTPNAKRLAVELSLPVLTTWVCPDMSGMYLNATAAVEWWKWIFCSYLPFADNSPPNSSRSNYHCRMFFFSQICLELQMNQEM